MINYNKLMQKLKDKKITTYIIRQKGLIPQGIYTKMKMCSGDVSTKTIEDICQLLQCQPQDLIEWKVDLKPELSYENRYMQDETEDN